MSERSDSPIPPAPGPQWDQPGRPDWGPTTQPVMEPADEPRGARTGMLWILGIVVIVAVVLLIIALVRS